MRWTVTAALTIGILLAGSPGANAAPRAPIAAAIHLTSMHMIDARVGWGQNGREVFRTINGGQFWTDVTPAGARNAGVIGTTTVPGAFFLSASNAWLAATSGRDLYNGRIVVYRTTDGGLHWQTSTGVPATGTAGISFTNGRDGWLFVSKGPGAGQNPYILLRSVDGGAHWGIVAQSTPRPSRGSFPGCNCTGGITFRNGATGWSTGTQFALQLRDWLWVSHDGGFTWRHQSLPIPSGFIVYYTDAPVFTGQREGGFLAELMRVNGSGNQTYALYVTRDGGTTWSRGALLSTLQGGIITSSIVDPLHAWVSDGRRLYRTADGGRHWTSIYPRVPSFARAYWTNGRITASSPDTTIDFVSASAGFAYDPAQHGTRRFFLKTVDGGATWQAVYPLSGGLPLHG